MKKKSLLITGVDGLLGSALKSILENEFVIIPFKGNITKKEDIEKYHTHIDWIVHAAAFTDVSRCEKEQELCRAVNIEGTKNMRDLAERNHAKFLYISTVSVFSGEEGNYKESDVPKPSNVYNITKHEGEKITLEYNQGLVLRINLIGIHPDGSRGQNFMEWLYDSVKKNKDMKLFSDVIINPLSNWTVAEFIKNIIEKDPKEKILHIASQNTLSKADIGILVANHLGQYSGKIKVTSIDRLEGPVRPKQMWMNTDYTCQKMHWHMPTLESEINKILEK